MTKKISFADQPWAQDPVLVPLNQAFPQLGELREFRSKWVLFNHDRTIVHNVVSPRYRLVKHRELMETAANAVAEELGIKDPKVNVRTAKNGARMRASIPLPGVPDFKFKGEEIRPLVSIMNSYDSTWQFGVLLECSRLVCANGMRTTDRFGGYTARHFHGNLEGGKVREAVRAMLDNSGQLLDIWRRWHSVRVSHGTAEAVAERLSLGKRYRAGWMDPKNFPMTIWDLYNHCTYGSTHLTRSFNRRVELDEAIARLFYDESGILAEAA